MLGGAPDDPLRFGVVPGNRRDGGREHGQLASVGRMRVDLADQHVKVGHGGLGHRPVYQLGAADLHVHYFGAGSSGRIGVLDAAEVVPTFGVDASLFVAHHAGGESAVAHAAEGAEDRESLGREAAAEVTAGDVAVGLSASGRTPYVAGVLRAARAAGALAVLVSSNLSAPLAELADRSLLVDTGPEAIAGSTRLKAATAQKMILNSLSTAVMIRLGRTYSNLMVSLSGTNAKLRQRQIFVLMETSGAIEVACRAELARCGGDLRLAMLCLLSGLEPEAAAQALAAGGSVRAALAATGTATRGRRELSVSGEVPPRPAR